MCLFSIQMDAISWKVVWFSIGKKVWYQSSLLHQFPSPKPVFLTAIISRICGFIIEVQVCPPKLDMGHPSYLWYKNKYTTSSQSSYSKSYHKHHKSRNQEKTMSHSFRLSCNLHRNRHLSLKHTCFSHTKTKLILPTIFASITTWHERTKVT